MIYDFSDAFESIYISENRSLAGHRGTGPSRFKVLYSVI